MAQAQSVTTFMIGDGLPWQEERACAEEPGPLDSALIFGPGFRRHCTIRKISALGATLSGGLDATPGDRLAIELTTGQRAAGTIAWANGGNIGLGFSQPVDVLALINRKLISQPAERRAMPRVEIRCEAAVKSGQDYLAATLRNISARGLQLDGDPLPRPGTYVNVFIDGLIVPPGEVVWTRGPLAGIELLEELSWSSILPWIRERMRGGRSQRGLPLPS